MRSILLNLLNLSPENKGSQKGDQSEHTIRARIFLRKTSIHQSFRPRRPKPRKHKRSDWKVKNPISLVVWQHVDLDTIHSSD